ncbi:MAG TPA: hypothetical protein VD866_21305 [Urbifossiella sp.]|nr:hypothetical protein [Urbifossiella sp.]
MTRALLVAVALAASAGPAAAAPVTPLFGGYASNFVDHWADFFKKQNGIIMAALGVGAVSLFIITRGKWLK